MRRVRVRRVRVRKVRVRRFGSGLGLGRVRVISSAGASLVQKAKVSRSFGASGERRGGGVPGATLLVRVRVRVGVCVRVRGLGLG